MKLDLKNTVGSVLVGVLALAGGGSAIAADLGESYDAVPPSAFSQLPWSGAYVGAHIGGGWGPMEADYAGSSASADMGGVAGGGHVGYNFRLPGVVLGVEGDVDASSIQWSVSGSIPGLGSASVSAGPKLLASVRGRVGFPVGTKIMIYGTGGVAWTNLEGKLTVSGESASIDKTATGYVAGGGVELRLNRFLSSRVEALHYGFDANVDILGAPINVNTEVTTIRAGLSYNFN